MSRTTRQAMELKNYVRIAHTHWILIVALTLVGVAVGALLALTTAPRYVSTTQQYVSVRVDGAAAGDLVQGTNLARQMVASYVAVVNTAIVLDPVIDELNLDLSTQELSSKVTAANPVGTNGVTISVSDSDPLHAANIANAVAASFSTAVETTLERPAEGQAATVLISIVQPAVPAVAPASPNVPLYIVVGGILGVALGIGIAVLRTVLDTRIHSLHDIESITDAPMLGGIAFDPEAPKRPLVVHVDPRSPRAETFRTLRTNLQFLGVDGDSRVFVVSSAGPAEGKSTTTANLAIALAETGAKVALVDGDLRKPRVAEYLGIEGAVGLSDVLIGRVALSTVIQRWGSTDLFVLPAGRIPPNPAELLGSHAMDDVLAELRTHLDYVLIDGPPLLAVTDAALLGKKASGVILVAASGSTKKQLLEGAVRSLTTAGAKLLGVVVTMLPTRGPDSYAYGNYGYGYGYGHEVQGGENPRRRSLARRREG